MHYAHDVTRATELLRAATGFMGQREIPPEPANYAIWYTYAAEENTSLSNELRALIASGANFDQRLNRRLYETYFGLTKISMAIANTGAKLHAAMDSLGRNLEHAGKQTGEHCDRLLSMIDDGALATAPDQFLPLVRGVVAETQAIVITNQALEGQLAEAVGEIAALRESLEQSRIEAMSDPLTGVVNRKYLEVRLAEQIELAASTGQELCLILSDIDNFKSFNDTYGHQVGDQVLRAVARAIDDNIRGGDILARYGGEEFCVILPNTPLKGGAAVAENLRGSIARKTLKSGKDGRDFGSVTASFGVADHKPGETIEDFIGRADAALYAAKNDGRNQIALKSHAADTD
jgi:diguanylate cyclase